MESIHFKWWGLAVATAWSEDIITCMCRLASRVVRAPFFPAVGIGCCWCICLWLSPCFACLLCYLNSSSSTSMKTGLRSRCCFGRMSVMLCMLMHTCQCQVVQHCPWPRSSTAQLGGGLLQGFRLWFFPGCSCGAVVPQGGTVSALFLGTLGTLSVVKHNRAWRWRRYTRPRSSIVAAMKQSMHQSVSCCGGASGG